MSGVTDQISIKPRETQMKSRYPRVHHQESGIV